MVEDIGQRLLQVRGVGAGQPKMVGLGRRRSAHIGKHQKKAIGGLTIVPDMVLSDLVPTESAMLILPGGTRCDAGELSEVFPHLEQLLDAGVPVAAICGATSGLARGGFLDNVRHTSNAAQYRQATGYGGAARYQNAAAVTDGNLITAGATGALEFAVQIFRRLSVYSEAVLDAWYALFQTGDSSHFMRLQALEAAESTP